MHATQHRARWLDATRGVAIMLVVAGHAIQFTSPVDSDFYRNPVFATIYAFHMPLFAALGGYLLRPSIQRAGPARALAKRVRSLLVPFLSWTALIAASFAVAAAVYGSAAGLLPQFARNFASMLVWPAPSLWFLWALFVASSITALLAAPFGPWRLGALAVASMALYALPQEQMFAVAQIQWLFPFVLGGFCAHKWRSVLVRHEAALTVLAAIIFVTLRVFWTREDFVYIHQMRVLDTFTDTMARYAYRYAIAVAGIAFVVGVIRWASRRWRVPRLSGIGRASLGIYAVQTVLFIVVAKLPAFENAGVRATWAAAVAVAVLVVSYLAVVAMERYRPTRIVLLGGR